MWVKCSYSILGGWAVTSFLPRGLTRNEQCEIRPLVSVHFQVLKFEAQYLFFSCQDILHALCFMIFCLKSDHRGANIGKVNEGVYGPT